MIEFVVWSRCIIHKHLVPILSEREFSIGFVVNWSPARRFHTLGHFLIHTHFWLGRFNADSMIDWASRGQARKSVPSWRYIPKDLPPKSTLCDDLDLWNHDGTWSKIHHGPRRNHTPAFTAKVA